MTILILPLLILAAVNYHFDPDYTLRKDYIPELTEQLLNENIVSGPVNINSRALKKQWIKNLPYSPELVVLGSSRTLPLTKETFENTSFFNASLTNCTWQDMYAVVNWLDKKEGKFPSEVIICADQWLFNENFNEKRWLQNREDILEIVQNTKISGKDFPSKWSFQKEWIKELFSVRYFIRSLRYRGKAEHFKATTEIDSTKMNLLPDGSRYLPKQLTEPSEETLHQAVENYVRTSNDELFSELSAQQCQLFENLLKLLQERQCKITLFIPPFHPTATEYYRNNPKTSGIEKTNQYIQHLAKRENLNVIVCSNPSEYELQPDDFYDAVHLKPTVLKAVFENAFKNQAYEK